MWVKAGEPGWQWDKPQTAGRSRVLLSKEVLEPSVTGKSPVPSPPDFNMESVPDAPFPLCTDLFFDDKLIKNCGVHEILIGPRLTSALVSCCLVKG